MIIFELAPWRNMTQNKLEINLKEMKKTLKAKQTHSGVRFFFAHILIKCKHILMAKALAKSSEITSSEAKQDEWNPRERLFNVEI